MFEILNALAAVIAVTVALTLTSLDRQIAMLLGLTGGLTGTFLAWVTVPGAWEHSLALPWVSSVVGTIAVVAGWSAVRAYSGLFHVDHQEPDRDPSDDDRELVGSGR
ncbi:hypothetical protein ACTJKO_11920 [Curtobacterium sp. 22159]|uniref:hypothetical protein n=1 Tax=Curtobacterium sp. 22159 TaxID=3453882 RepID=UPI003F86C55D